MQQQHQLLEQPSQTSGSNMFEQSYPGPGASNQSNDGDSANGTSSSSDSADEDQIRIKFADWGFKIDRLFEVAYRFYKRNEGKAFHPSFDERNKMIALIMQARYGNLDGGKAPELGVLDLVGKGRQHEWSLLNGMSKTEAMSKFICALDDLCPLFKAHAEAVKLSSGIELSPVASELVPGNETSGNTLKKSEMDTQMHNIYSSLCKQTYNQFKGYAEKQYPNEAVKQKYLITSLQEQYYQQYISQMHPELKSSLPDSSQMSNHSSIIPSSLPSPAGSDRSSHKNGSELRADKTTNDPTIISENHLALVPSAPHLELPLPPNDNGACHPKTSQEMYNTTSKTLGNTSSIYESDIYCEENNVEADISSEELNSELITTVSPSAQMNGVAGDLAQDLKSISIVQHGQSKEPEETEAPQRGFMEPIRIPSNSDFSPIGVFESFPEPKPIKGNSQKSTPIDQINPNLPSQLPTQAPHKLVNIQDEPQAAQAVPQDSTDMSIQHGFSLTHNEPTPEMSANQQATDQQTSTNDLVEQSSIPLNVQQGIEANERQQGYNEVASNQFSSSAELHVDQEDLATTIKTTSDSYSENNESHHLLTEQGANNQGPELWDSVSSCDGNSPVQQLIAYEEPEAATIWSKREIHEFKESLGDDKQGGIYEVKESTLVIIQVPTYPDGKYIYWEFATDDFDIGFGLEFVYEKHLSEPLALNIYEDLDEDDMDDMIEEDDSSWPTEPKSSINSHYNNHNLDPESGVGTSNNLSSHQVETRRRMLSEKRQRLANTISIVPTYRRDSHQEVFVGRHKYPGQGYYLLRFDNTYSVLRSKTLYFRICYFM